MTAEARRRALDQQVRIALRAAREEAGMSLGRAALAAGLTTRRLQSLEESGTPLYFDEVLRLAGVYGVSIGQTGQPAVRHEASSGSPRVIDDMGESEGGHRE